MTTPSTIVVVGRDALLQQVVRFLLPHPSATLLHASGLDDALAQMAQEPPRLAVIDLPSGEGAAHLPFQLRAQFGPIPIILLTPDPTALPAFPPEWQPPPRLLGRPPDINALRQAMAEAWAESAPAEKARSPAWNFIGRVATLAVGLIVVIVGLLLILPMLHVPYVPNVLKMIAARPAAVEQPPATTVHLIDGKPDTFRLEEDAAKAMRIPAPYRIQSEPGHRQTTLTGSLAFDPNLLGRVQSRFSGELIAIAPSTEPVTGPKGQTAKEQTLSYGNRVAKDQLMAIVWSKELGEKKSELVDWHVKLALDDKNLKELEDLFQRGATPYANYRAAQIAVSTDLNNIARVRRTLDVWKVKPEEIKEIEEEAKRILLSKNIQDLNQIKSSHDKWARVEVRAPFDGIIVEKNLAIGSMVDPTQDLFRVADMRKLAVFANAYEEDQRLLQDMQAQLRPALVPWRVFLTSDPDKTSLSSDGIERIGYIVDPTQRTNLVIGKVDNKDDRLRVGNSVTALVAVPAPPDVVSIPATALVEDGDDSVVFVQPDPKKLVYVMKRVFVVQRFNGQAYVLSKLTDKQKKAGLMELHPGEWLVASAVVQLKAGLEEVQARARQKKEESGHGK
jgi:cobalt-zinc-cadmium efflux system membrane fusion protein